LQQTYGFLRCACRSLALDSPPARVTFLHYQQDWPLRIHSAVGHRRKMRTMNRCKHGNSGGGVVSSKKIAIVSLLCAVVALAACRREECCQPLKLGGPVAEQPGQ
jgi:hypothetical protein